MGEREGGREDGQRTNVLLRERRRREKRSLYERKDVRIRGWMEGGGRGRQTKQEEESKKGRTTVGRIR